MSLASIIRGGVALVNTITLDGKLQGLVTYQAWRGSTGGYGAPLYEEPVELRAIIDQTEQPRRTAGGEMVLTKASVMFLVPLPSNGSEGRTEPIDTRDIITLPDGTTGPILTTGGFIDGETGAPYFLEIYLGA